MAEDGSMTLTGHLKELRNRLIICAVVFVVGVVVSLAYADRLIDLLTAMGRDYYQFVSIAPQEKLMQYFRVSILAGVVVTVPVAFYNIYAFAKPGLKKSESTFFKLCQCRRSAASEPQKSSSPSVKRIFPHQPCQIVSATFWRQKNKSQRSQTG